MPVERRLDSDPAQFEDGVCCHQYSALAQLPSSDDELVLMVRALARHALGDEGEVGRLIARLRDRGHPGRPTAARSPCSGGRCCPSSWSYSVWRERTHLFTVEGLW